MLGWRALRTFALTRRATDLSVAVGIVWLAAALTAALLLDYWNLGWWLGHAFEIVGIFCIGVPVALDLYRGTQSRPLIGDLRASELVASEEAFLGSEVRALMVALAVKDEYTETHTRRVAMLAVRVAEHLRLPHARLRTLALDTCVLAVCDVYDALCSERVYRPAWTHEQALALLRSGAGTEFDPRCVRALAEILAHDRLDPVAPVVRPGLATA